MTDWSLIMYREFRYVFDLFYLMIALLCTIISCIAMWIRNPEYDSIKPC